MISAVAVTTQEWDHRLKDKQYAIFLTANGAQLVRLSRTRRRSTSTVGGTTPEKEALNDFVKRLTNEQLAIKDNDTTVTEGTLLQHYNDIMINSRMFEEHGHCTFDKPKDNDKH